MHRTGTRLLQTCLSLIMTLDINDHERDRKNAGVSQEEPFYVDMASAGVMKTWQNVQLRSWSAFPVREVRWPCTNLLNNR